MKLEIRRIRKRKKHPVNKTWFRQTKLWMLANLSPRMLDGLKVGLMVFTTIVLMIVVYMGERSGILFKASVLEAPQPFNGTVLPISKVPNWVHWMNGQPDMSVKYDQIPENMLIDLPNYDLSKMQFPDSKLVWGDASQDSIRNTKITYPVVYLGDYKYDHLENAGSHLAVDIKIPQGTPVHAIANGKVVTVSLDSTGFGHHVVVKHTNVPDPDNPGIRTTLYSCYDHLSDINVAEGENVLKGEVIAKSGNTGTSTTPHLHFQIDRDSAPWHPYWPFTYQDEVAAKLSFFEAVDAGLGINKARLYTVNPMRFVVQDINSFSVATAGNASVPETGTVTSATANATTTPAVTPANTVSTATPVVVASNTATPATTQTVATTETTKPVAEVVNPLPADDKSGLFEYRIFGESVGMVGSAVTLIVQDQKGQVASLGDEDVIRTNVQGVGNLLKKQFKKTDFVNNTLKLFLKSDTAGIANVTIGKTPFQVTFVDSVSPVASFRIDSSGKFQKNIEQEIKVVALDGAGNLAAAVNFSGYVEIKAVQGQAELSPNMLSKEDFKGGTAIVKLVSSGVDPIVLRAQIGALVGQSESIKPETSALFKDVKTSNPDYEAIKYLKELGVISGYGDGTFKPNKTVNRAEVLKMLMMAFNGATVSNTKLTFKDVDSKAWYAGTLAAAVDKGIVSGYADGTFKPGDTMNRAEYLKMFFKTVKIEPSKTDTKPYADVSASIWYAPYAYLANKMNIIDVVNNLFKPSDGMTRAKVAETIYRMKMIQANGWVTFAK